MRLLAINARANAASLPGGDSIQMEKTCQALQALGVTIEARQPADLDRMPVCDLAHVYNIQEPETTWQVFESLTRRGIPFVLSSIYWDMYEYWAEEALHKLKSWKRLASIYGMERARKLYLRWQYLKAPGKQPWRLKRKLLQTARRVLPNSHSEVAHLQKSFWLGDDFREKVDVVPNAIDTSLYLQRPRPSQAFLEQYNLRDFVLEVGTIYPVKNQLGLLEALEDVPVPVVFIGQVMEARSEYALACKELARQRGNVLFLDWVDHTQLKNIYALAAVHALPSWRETPGLVSLEAAAAGCNVVTTSIGSTYDYFGDLAYYCHPGDQASIRAAVVSALENHPKGKLRERVLAEFTWQRAAQATLDSYTKALNSI